MANAGLASEVETYVFLSTEGVYLVMPGYADGIHEAGFKPLYQMMDIFVASGGHLLVCSLSLKRRGLDEQAIQFGAKVVCGGVIIEILYHGASYLAY